MLGQLSPAINGAADTTSNYSEEENDAIRNLAMLVERRWQQVFNPAHPLAGLIAVQMRRLNPEHRTANKLSSKYHWLMKCNENYDKRTVACQAIPAHVSEIMHERRLASITTSGASLKRKRARPATTFSDGSGASGASGSSGPRNNISQTPPHEDALCTQDELVEMAEREADGDDGY